MTLRVLADAPPVDGNDEIVARPPGYFWEGCRGKVFTFVVIEGGSSDKAYW